jgi:hypothetical protein
MERSFKTNSYVPSEHFMGSKKTPTFPMFIGTFHVYRPSMSHRDISWVAKKNADIPMFHRNISWVAKKNADIPMSHRDILWVAKNADISHVPSEHFMGSKNAATNSHVPSEHFMGSHHGIQQGFKPLPIVE